jgi:heme-degrading monooxygenase HmoA
MIARIWTARSTSGNAERYQQHFERDVLPALRRTTGYVGSTVLRQATGADTLITVITRWQSMDAIQQFAGPDLDRAVVADEAVRLLTAWDRRVQHHDIAFNE